jgi:copper(I)-binding protein
MVGALALAGCGAGQITQTSSQASGVGGASANVGQIAIREAAFAFAGDGKTAAIYQEGSEAPLSMTVVNFGGQVDKLTNVSSPVAESGQITGDGTIASGRVLLVEGSPPSAPAAATPGASAQATPGARPSAAPGASAQATPAPGASAQATPAPGASAQATPAPSAEATPALGPTEQASSAPAAGANPGSRPAPATAGPEAAATAAAGAAAPSSGVVEPGTTTAQVVLTGLKQDLQVGPTYPVVLTFQRAGAVTIQVPVANPSENQGPSGE